MDKVLASSLEKGDCIKFGLDGSVYQVTEGRDSIWAGIVGVWCLHDGDKLHGWRSCQAPASGISIDSA